MKHKHDKIHNADIVIGFICLFAFIVSAFVYALLS